MGIVETEIPAENTTPETASEWFDHNVRATFHTLIDAATLRSESESTVLHALVDDLDKDPSEIIAKLAVAPISAGGNGYVDPVLAQILKDNADLRRDMKNLLEALAANNSTAETAAVAAAETELTVTEPASDPFVGTTPAPSVASPPAPVPPPAA